RTCATRGAVEYSGTEAGLLDITFTIAQEPAPGQILSCILEMEPVDTWTCDENVEENEERNFKNGLYTIEGYLPKPYLAMTPDAITKPDIDGDRFIGTPRAIFQWDIMAKDFMPQHDIILAQFTVTYDPTLLKVNDVLEGTFMNDTTWAPYGTFFAWGKDYEGYIWGFILINTNPDTGEWDWTERPTGEGVLVSIIFEAIYQEPKDWTASCPIDLEGVFDEYFVNTNIEYVPYAPEVDGTYTVNGYNWANPVALFTWDPPQPLVGTVVTFDASASYGFRNEEGTLVPDPTYIKEYKWNFGDGNITTTTNPIITHVYDAMGLYIVTLTVKDYDNRIGTKSAEINVVFGRLIDVFTQYDPPYGGQGINKTSDMFWPQKHVILTAILTYNGDPVQHKPVAFQIVSPTGYWNFTRVEFTDENGIAIIDFGLPWPCDYPEELVFGVWTVIAKADIQCVTCEDWLWFKVYWYTYNLTVTPKETSYAKGENAEFEITFYSCSRQQRWVLVTVTVYDDLNVPIAQNSTWVLVGDEQLQWCTFKEYTLTLEVLIPKYALVGTGKVYVNTFWNWPMECGYPLSPEAKATFRITKA
ncbi:MAG: PKD domain-containing protein, partial [Candidatus Bathyarchaeales archaeon]